MRRALFGIFAAITLLAPAAFADGVTFNAYLDGYYGYNFNRPPALTSPNASSLQNSQNGSYRAFDQYSDQFILNLAELEVSKRGNEAGFLVDFDFGNQAEVLANSGGAFVGPNTSVDGVSKNIGQAYMTYSPQSAPNLSFKFGKMYSPLDWETTKAKDNWQYSRSILFSIANPYWYTGLNVSYALLPGKLVATAMVFDGWNTLYSVNSGKNFGGSLAWTPSNSFSATYNVISGPNQANDNGDWRTVHEANATYTLNPTLSLAGDVAAGMANNDISLTGNPVSRATWQAIEAAMKVTLSPRYYLSPRYEVYWDHQGFSSGTPQTLQELTLTNSFSLANGLAVRVEFRYDHSTADTFQSNTGFRANQVTGSLAVLYYL